MGYEIALIKAWAELDSLGPQKEMLVRFFAQDYRIDFNARKVLVAQTNLAARDFTVILILHYLARKLIGLPDLTGEWITFRELEGGEYYYSAFKKRAIEPILSKYCSNPQSILAAIEKGVAKKVDHADLAIVVDVFENVPVLVEFWKPDAEFAPQANMLFDRNIAKIFCTEDIAVMGGFVSRII